MGFRLYAAGETFRLPVDGVPGVEIEVEQPTRSGGDNLLRELMKLQRGTDQLHSVAKVAIPMCVRAVHGIETASGATSLDIGKRPDDETFALLQPILLKICETLFLVVNWREKEAKNS